MKEEYKVGLDVAEAEFERFVEENDLLLDEDTISKMDAVDKTAFEKTKSRLIRELRRGFLTIDEDGQPSYTPHSKQSKSKEAIVFKQRTGASIMAMDGKKDNESARKSYAVMAQMCGVSPSVFAGLAGTDIKVCEAIFALLMD